MENVIKTLEQAKVTARLAIAFAAEQGYLKNAELMREEIKELDDAIAETRFFMVDHGLSNDKFMAACKRSMDEMVGRHGISLEYRASDRRYYAYRNGEFLWSGDAWFNVAQIALALANGSGHVAQNMSR